MAPPPDSPLSDERLRANLRALAAADPSLAERIALPVDGEHVSFGPRGEQRYRLHRTVFPLELDAAAVGRALEPADRGAREVPAERPLVLGLGAGELAAALLARPDVARVTAWDRDPWLVRLALMRHDWSREIEAGRLRLALCSDCLALAAQEGAWDAVVEHPFLGGVYADEQRLLGARTAGPDEAARPWALVCTGGLFVDSLGAALRAEGYRTLALDVRRLAVEELDLYVERARPELIAAINYTHGLAEFAEARGIDTVCWEIDPATRAPRSSACRAERTRIFTYRRAHVPQYRRAGFPHVEYLPLAADPDARAPVALTGAEERRYRAPVAFVGSSLAANAAGFRRCFLDLYARWRASGASTACAREEGERVLVEVLATQRAEPWRWLVPELLGERCPGLLAWCRDVDADHDPVVLAGEIAASEKRLGYAAHLARFGLQVWGDAGWRSVEPLGVRYRGPAAHARELDRIYSGAAVNLDVGRLYQSDIVTMRVFDVLACGGYALVEHTDALAELFELGVELESYRTPDELVAKLEHALANPGHARRVAERGRAAVLERHAFVDRVRHMLASFRSPELELTVAG